MYLPENFWHRIKHDQRRSTTGLAMAAIAVRITSVTACGCEIIITCEPSTSVIVAPARWALERTTSVPAALS